MTTEHPEPEQPGQAQEQLGEGPGETAAAGDGEQDSGEQDTEQAGEATE